MTRHTIFRSLLFAVLAGGIGWLAVNQLQTEETIYALAEHQAAIAEHAAQPQAAQATPATKPVKPQEHVIHLPEDGHRYYTTLVTSENWRASPRERELVAWFSGHPRLVSLKSQTHWNHYTDRSPLYRMRIASAIPPNEIPVLMVQTGDGAVVYKGSAASLPADPSELADQIQQRIDDCFPRPKPPTPTPGPAPSPEPAPSPIPDLGPRPSPIPDAPKSDNTALLIGAAAFIAMLLASIGSEIKGRVGR